MRRHAKASSAGSTSGQATGLGSISRGALAGRASSLSADGSGAPSGRSHLALVVLTIAALALLALAPSAMASVTTRAKTGSFGSDGTSATSFGAPSKLAFDQTSDKLYVLDRSGPAIHAFTAPGLGLSGAPFPLSVAGPGGEPDISADSSNHNVYYLSENDGLYGFDSTTGAGLAGLSPKGGFGDPCGSGVDPSSNIWVGDYSSQSVKEYDTAGNSLGSVDTSAQGSPCHVAFDSNGDMFVSMYFGATWKYTAPAYTTATQIDSGSARAIAVDTVAHTLYVAHSDKVSAYNAGTGAALYDFASGISGESLTGVTVDQGPDTAYVSDPGNGKVYSFSAVQSYGDATAATTPATNITDTSATINATITDNNALQTSWRLELSIDGGANWSTAASGTTAGGQSGVAVSGNVTGLTPNSPSPAYRFRVVTNKGPSAATEVTSNAAFFGTLSVPPALSNVGSVDVQDTSARMVGTIDPRNSATGYVFQYGTTPALGSQTAPVNVGGGTTPKTFSQLVSGLDKDTTYYFRLVATNAFGSTASNERSFHTRVDAIPLPDSRAYEMVSPPDKNGGDVNRVNVSGAWDSIPAPDGERVAFCTASLFGEEPSQLAFKFCTSYLSRRTPGGWETKNLMPRFCYADSAASGQFARGPFQFVDMNLDRFVTAKPELKGCPVPLLDPAASFSPDVEQPNLYLQDPSGNIDDPASFSLISSGVIGNGVVGASADMSHIFFRSVANQTPQPDSPAPGAFEKLYEWIEPGPDCGLADPSYRPALGACLRLASVKPDGTPFTDQSAYPDFEYSASGPNLLAYDGVSRDGRRIYFQNRFAALGPNGISVANPPCSLFGADCQLYMREDGTTTYKVSESECTVDCDTIDSSSAFEWVTPDGSVALFTSSDKLSNDGFEGGGILGTQLYRWDRDAAPGSRLTSLGNVGTPIGVSDDGDTVYTYGGPFFGGKAIRRWQWNGGSPTSDLIASTEGASIPDNLINQFRAENVTTPDGRYLLLSTDRQLDPVADTDADRDIYRWDEANGLVCLSCQLPGVASKGSASLGVKTALHHEDTTPTGLGSRTHQPVMSPDGKRVFFDTPDALVPEDTNGEAGCPATNPGNIKDKHYTCSDVYEWNDGRVSLITPGKSPSETYLLGADWSNGADNVFFYTRERLVGWDVDNNVDIYDARVGGGFPEPPPTGAPCEADACRGAGSTPSSVPGAGSGVFQGPGNPPAKHSHPKKKHPKKHHHHKRAHHRAAKHNRRAAR